MNDDMNEDHAEDHPGDHSGESTRNGRMPRTVGGDIAGSDIAGGNTVGGADDGWRRARESRRAARRLVRAEFAERRAHGLRRRHATKLHRLAQRGVRIEPDTG